MDSLIPRRLWREPAVTLGALAHGLTHHPRVLWAPVRHLLVVSHMRSNTTVLSYILGSHPQIAGAAEIHQRYRRPLDLAKLRCRLLRKHRGKQGARYFLDKLLHDQYEIADSLLRRDDVQLLFLLRRPEQTLRSIIAMGQGEGEPAWYREPERVAGYYEARLRFMAHCAERIDRLGAAHRACLLTAEDFLARPEATLAALSLRLGLSPTLSTGYQVFDFTGRIGAGDRSASIRTGQVVREATDYSAITLDDALVERTRRAHADALQTITRHVQPIA